MERLFEPFFTSKDGGTGLGLAIANKIVVAHGGTIEYRNREQGGAVFTITFPIIGTGEHEARPATTRTATVAATVD
jgi:signal transduction histidine kinase